MNQFIQTLNRYFFPVLLIVYLALCLVLLAVVPEGKGGLLLALLWAVVTATALRWSIRGVLTLAKKKADFREMTLLLRTVEVFLLLVTVAAGVFALLLREIPSVWLFFPTPLFALQGVVKMDAER